MKNTVILLIALASTSLASAQKLVIKGSDTLGAKLVPTLAEEYKAKNPGVSFEIAAEGSTTGIAAIIDGTAQIGMSSRRAKPTEMSAASAKGVTIAMRSGSKPKFMGLESADPDDRRQRTEDRQEVQQHSAFCRRPPSALCPRRAVVP